jgi:hypothetical protein
VQDLPTGVLDHEEAVQQLKVGCRNREEVEGDNCFSMIRELSVSLRIGCWFGK